jgi:hypothetical protein
MIFKSKLDGVNKNIPSTSQQLNTESSIIAAAQLFPWRRYLLFAQPKQLRIWGRFI